MIVGNKVDKETFSREVSTKEGEEFAKRMNCLFIGERWNRNTAFLGGD